MNNINEIRKEVFVIAHSIKKTVATWSEALKKAWVIVKGKKIYCKVAGVSYGSRQEALNRLAVYLQNKAVVKTVLVRDAENKFDKNAVKVMVSVNNSNSYHLGYLPKEVAVIVAPIMDKVKEVKTHLVKVTGYDLRGAQLVVHF